MRSTFIYVFGLCLLCSTSLVVLLKSKEVVRIQTNQATYLVSAEDHRALSDELAQSAAQYQTNLNIKTEQLIRRLRANAQTGVKAYANWTYSMEGAFVLQAAALMKGVYTVGKHVATSETLKRKTQAVTQQMNAKLQEMIFSKAGFHDPLERELISLQGESKTVTSELLTQVNSRYQSKALLTLSKGSTLDQLLNSPSISLPQTTISPGVKLGTSMAGGVILGAQLAFRAGSRLAGLIFRKVVLRVAGKTAIKAGTRLAGAGQTAAAGGSACIPGGPIAIGACATVGAIVGFFAVEVVINSLDQLFNQDDFEQELTIMVDQMYQEMGEQLATNLGQGLNVITHGIAEANSRGETFRLIDALPKSRVGLYHTDKNRDKNRDVY